MEDFFDRLSLRPMTEEAAEEIAGWEYGEPYGAYSFKGKPDGWLMNRDTWGKEQFFLADGESVAGYLSCQFDCGVLWVGWSLNPSLCGKGFGHLFVKRCVQALCREKSWDGKVCLRVAAGNTRAIRAYERAGFVCESVIRDEIPYTGHPEEFYVMSRQEGGD